MKTVLTSKGQVVIPSQIRKSLNLKQGTSLAIEWNEEEQTITLRPIEALLDRMMGSMREHPLVSDLETERTLDREREDSDPFR
jgi:AbrB family looped-hinge helix DNA binding protein